MILFVCLFFGAIALLVKQSGGDNLTTIWPNMAPMVIVNLSVTFVLVEGVGMLAEVFLKAREQAGRDAERERWIQWEQALREAIANKEELPPIPEKQTK
jgi:hypothetical protein